MSNHTVCSVLTVRTAVGGQVTNGKGLKSCELTVKSFYNKGQC